MKTMSNETPKFPADKSEKTQPDKGRAKWERPALRRLLTKEAQMPNVVKFNESNTGS